MMIKISILIATLVLSSHTFNAPAKSGLLINNDLQKLAGVWKTLGSAKAIYESWKKVNNHELSGFSFAVKGKDTVVFERTRIVESDGVTNYLTTVTGQNDGKEVAFKMVSSVNKKFVFENLQHDFPQRVVYEFLSPTSLHAWVEGNKQGKFEKEDYYYSRKSPGN